MWIRIRSIDRCKCIEFIFIYERIFKIYIKEYPSDALSYLKFKVQIFDLSSAKNLTNRSL